MTAGSTGPYQSIPEPALVTAKRSDKRIKTEMIGVRCTPAEADEIRSEASRRGLSPGVLLKACLTAVLTSEALRDAQEGAA